MYWESDTENSFVANFSHFVGILSYLGPFLGVLACYKPTHYTGISHKWKESPCWVFNFYTPDTLVVFIGTNCGIIIFINFN